MADRLISSDPDVMQTRQGGGCLTLFGLPFFLAGLFILSLPFKLFPVEGEIPWYVALPFGGVFAAVGAGLMFGRSGLIIDRRQKTIIQWWGLLVPMKRTEYLLDSFRRVTLGKEERDSGETSYTAFPVRLEGEGAVKPLEIEAPKNYEQARHSAEALAKFLNWPLADSSTGAKLVREPDRLDEPLREQARRERAPAEWATPPFGTRMQVRQEAGATVFDLPPPGLSLTHYLQLGFGLVFAGVVIYFFLGPLLKLPMPGVLRYFFLGFIGLFFVLGPILSALHSVWSQAWSRTRVVASREWLRVEERGLIRSKVREIPAAEIEELVLPEQKLEIPLERLPDGASLPPNSRTMAFLNWIARWAPPRPILARSDRQTLEFGRGLSPEELLYLYAEVKRILAE